MFCLPYLSPCFIILQVHQCSGVLGWTTWIILLPLPGIHELPGEAVAVVHVVAAAAPQPVAWQVTGSSRSAAAAGGEFALATCSADGVDHAGRADGVGEGCFPGAWGRGRNTEWTKVKDRFKHLNSHTQLHFVIMAFFFQIYGSVCACACSVTGNRGSCSG